MSVAGSSDPSDATKEIKQAQGPLVEAITVTKADSYYTVEAPGRLQALQQLSVVAEVSGKVSFVNPKFILGGRLPKGEIFFKINAVDYMAEVARTNASLKSAEASLVQAKADNTRQLDLVAQGAVSEASKDRAIANLAIAESGVLQAQAQLLRAEENLKRTTVKAPFPTLVATRTVSIDTYVAPGQALATILDARAGELVAGFSPDNAAAVSAMLARSGGRLKAFAKSNDGSVGSGSLEGYIEQFAPEVDQTSRSALVVAIFPTAFTTENEGKIFANDFMTLEVGIQSQEPIWQVPEGTVRKNSFIWIIEKGFLKKRAVTVLNSANGMTLFTSEMPLDDARVLMTLLSEESDGLQVRVAPNSTKKAQ